MFSCRMYLVYQIKIGFGWAFKCFAYAFNAYADDDLVLICYFTFPSPALLIGRPGERPPQQESTYGSTAHQLG